MLTFLFALLGRVTGDEFKAWAPLIIAAIVRFAVRHAPLDQKDRLAEEWNSHINSVPGDVVKIIAAVGFVVASANMSRDDVIKRAFDIVFSATMLAMLSPPLVLLAIFMRLKNGAPVLVRVRGKLRFRCEQDGWLKRYNFDALIGFADVLSGRANLVASERRGDGSLPGLFSHRVLGTRSALLVLHIFAQYCVLYSWRRSMESKKNAARLSI